MPSIETKCITLELPNDWRVFPDGNQFVAHGPDQEEVLISRIVVSDAHSENTNETSTESSSAALMSLESLILEAMYRGVQQPGLVVKGEISEKTVGSGRQVKQLSSVSTDGSVCFEEYGIIGDSEAVFLTYEAPISSRESLKLIETAIQKIS